jgi:signal peptide peptidase SppA
MLPHIAARVLGTPLVIGPAKLEAILAVLGPRIGIEAPTPAVVDGEVRRRGARVVTPEGIAVIPVFGTLVKRAGPIEAASGLTSYGELETAILDAATDPAVRAILLDVDSPGGEAAGVFDLADLIYEARSLKPVWAVANEEAFSGAYAIASAAERVVVPRTGGLGSIGVIALHVDRSARDAMEGTRYTTVYAGARKNDFNPHEPLSGDALGALQAEVDRVYGLFTDTVARNRRLSANAVRATEAGLFFGEDAVAAGLADEVGTMREALTALAGIASGSRLVPGAVTAAALPAPTIEEERMTAIGTTGGATPPDPGQAALPPESRTDTKALPDGAPVCAKPPCGPKTSGDGQGLRFGEGRVETGKKTAEVVNLEKIRIEARGDGYREAAGIAELCALAGMPERASEMIVRGLSVEEARKELLALKARGDGPEVQSHVMPGASTGQAMTLDDNPVVRAAKARAAAANMEV